MLNKMSFRYILKQKYNQFLIWLDIMIQIPQYVYNLPNTNIIEFFPYANSRNPRSNDTHIKIVIYF